MIRQSNLALLDGTFYKDGELPGRPMSEIPHPFIEESMTLFSSFKADDKKKIRFIHFNHTNPLLNQRSNESIKVLSKGFMIAEQGKFIVTK
jgi:pyrroloquinoline quinone biosynthesis protein B